MSLATGLSTADRIMNAALVMVQQRGFDGFSFRDVAAAVGIKSASIHYHFPTKPDLAKAVLSDVRNRFGEELRRIDIEVSGARDKLGAFADIFIETYGDGDRLCPFCMVACAQNGVPEDVRAEVRAFWSDGELWVSDVLRDASFGPHAAPDDEQLRRIRSSARLFVAGLEGAMVTARAFDDRERLTDAARWLVDCLIGATQ